MKKREGKPLTACFNGPFADYLRDALEARGQKFNSWVRELVSESAAETLGYPAPDAGSHGNSRLSDEAVRTIRSRPDGVTARELADQYGTTESYVRNIWSGTARSNVE